MTDHDLEDRLSAMMTRRAEDINAAPAIDFSSAGKGRTRLQLGPYAVAAAVAAVVLAAGGTVVGIRSIHHPPVVSPVHAPTATSTPPAFVDPNGKLDSAGNCLALPPTPIAEWNTAIAHGTKVVPNRPNNQVISVDGATSDYLMVQSTSGIGDSTLALFNGADSQDLLTAPVDSLIVDPSTAISPDWITYGVVHPGQHGGYAEVELYNRSSRSITTIDEVSDAHYSQGAAFSGTPVIYDDQVFWVQSQPQSGANELKSYNLATKVTSSVPAPNASGVFAYGTGLAIIYRDGNRTTVDNHLGQILPAWALQAMTNATVLTYAGPASVTRGQANITWEGNGSTYSWTLGTDSGDSMTETGVRLSPPLPAGAFAPLKDDNGKLEILDDRFGVRNLSPQTIPLPTGLSFDGLVGADLLFAVNAGKDGAASFVLVSVASLPKPIDYPGC